MYFLPFSAFCAVGATAALGAVLWCRTQPKRALEDHHNEGRRIPVAISYQTNKSSGLSFSKIYLEMFRMEQDYVTSCKSQY